MLQPKYPDEENGKFRVEYVYELKLRQQRWTKKMRRMTRTATTTMWFGLGYKGFVMREFGIV